MPPTRPSNLNETIELLMRSEARVTANEGRIAKLEADIVDLRQQLSWVKSQWLLTQDQFIRAVFVVLRHTFGASQVRAYAEIDPILKHHLQSAVTTESLK